MSASAGGSSGRATRSPPAISSRRSRPTRATFEITAPVGGTVLETFFEEGALVPVFTNCVVIGAPGESVDAFRPGGAGRRAGDSGPGTRGDSGSRLQASGLRATTAGKPRLSHEAAQLAARPRVLQSRARGDLRPSTVSSATSDRGLRSRGRVLEQDLRKRATDCRAASRAGGIRAHDCAPHARVAGVDGAVHAARLGRRARAARGARAQTRRSERRARPTSTSTTWSTFCTIRALLESPDLNAEFIDGDDRGARRGAHRLRRATRRAACMVPVVRNAHTLSIGRARRAHERLAAQAVRGHDSRRRSVAARRSPSATSAPRRRILHAVDQPPQVAILGVGAIQLKPVRNDREPCEFIDAIGLSLTCDHQVIDGAPGAQIPAGSLKETRSRALKDAYESISCRRARRGIDAQVDHHRPEPSSAESFPLNAYTKTVKEELADYSTEDLLNIWHDMCAIREFETVLNEIKTKGAYKGVTYNHAGPGASFDRAGSGGRRHGVLARRPTITSSARIAATARFWPRDSRRSGS